MGVFLPLTNTILKSRRAADEVSLSYTILLTVVVASLSYQGHLPKIIVLQGVNEGVLLLHSPYSPSIMLNKVFLWFA